MQYETMKSGERKKCVRLTAEAFQNYDFFTSFVPANKKTLFLENLFDCEFKAQHDAVFLTAKEEGEIVCVAMLYPPRHKAPSDFRYILYGILKARSIAGKRNFHSWLDMERKAISPSIKQNSSTTWFLNLLSVDDRYKGKGIGSKMICECIVPYVKSQGGRKLTLFTNSKSNCTFYEKNKFSQFDETYFEYDGKKIGSWSYYRNID